jgi:MHS family proline/betaine transporter-like MFS transporter
MIFGYLGDKKGRSHALSKTIIISAVATFAIGIIPSHEKIGLLAPIILILLRLIQGLAVSGEEGGAVVLLFERYAFKNKG